MRVVICGGGVIGACTTYFLAPRGIDVTVVERAKVAAAASARPAGFWRSTVRRHAARCAGPPEAPASCRPAPRAFRAVLTRPRSEADIPRGTLSDPQNPIYQ
jgi:glycine/D-amino acid oxidase-like deaminating enzyme